MTADLTPALALAYLAELQPRLAALAVAGSDGRTLAGDPSLASAASGGAKGLMSARTGDHLVLARLGPGALPGLVRYDLETVAHELE